MVCSIIGFFFFFFFFGGGGGVWGGFLRFIPIIHNYSYENGWGRKKGKLKKWLTAFLFLRCGLL